MTFAVLTVDLTRNEVVALECGQEVILSPHELLSTPYLNRLNPDCQLELANYFCIPPQSNHYITEIISTDSA